MIVKRPLKYMNTRVANWYIYLRTTAKNISRNDTGIPYMLKFHKAADGKEHRFEPPMNFIPSTATSMRAPRLSIHTTNPLQLHQVSRDLHQHAH